jgi:hypothetical protein
VQSYNFFLNQQKDFFVFIH